MKTLCVDLGGSRVKLALMTADSHPQPDVFEVDSRAPLAQTLSLVAQHAAAWGQPDAVSIALHCWAKCAAVRRKTRTPPPSS